MFTTLRKTNLIILAVFIVYVLFFLSILLAMKEIGVPIAPISKTAFTTIAVLTVVLSSVSLVAPWIIRSGKIRLPIQPLWPLNHVGADIAILIYGYVFLLCPVIYGLILYLCGSSISLFYGFLGASTASALVWSLFNNKQR
jgi:hypothetical protein